MGDANTTESLLDAFGQALLELGARYPEMVVFDGDPAEASRTAAFAREFPDRFFHIGNAPASLVAKADELASGDRPVVVSAPAAILVGPAYHAVREAAGSVRANVKLVGTYAGLLAGADFGVPAMVEDLGIMRGLPGMTVAVPADAPTTRTAMSAIAGFTGPAYLRLAGENLPIVTDGTFQIGRAATLREGSDLAIVAVGSLVARALAVAEELGRVGVSVRVLDFASIKPFDEKALLRAARECGAILTMEEHSVLTGLGALVASATAEETPVPVRRVGVPDLFVGPGDARTVLDRHGLSKERCLEEAWTLLRARGKVQ